MSNGDETGTMARRARRFIQCLGVIAALSCSVMADTIVFTTNTTISDTNFTYDGHDIVVEGCTLTINGAHSFNSLTVQRSASNVAGVVTHTAGFDNGSVLGLELVIAADVYIEGADGSLVASEIHANGKGYGSGLGSGAGSSASCWPCGGGGGGYGGRGGGGKNGASGGVAYGSITEPLDLGSGGGPHTSHEVQGGVGGGALQLNVGGTLLIDGSLSANGGYGSAFSSTCASGGGSGGSIYLTIGTLAGSGTISAHGGSGGGVSGEARGGGGGGGRIAIYYDASTFSGILRARGKTGDAYGGAGTIYTKSVAQTWGELLIENGGHDGAPTPLTGTYSFDEVTITDAVHTHLWGAWSIDKLSVSGSTLLQLANTLTAIDATVTGGSVIEPYDSQEPYDIDISGNLTLSDEATKIDGDGHLEVGGDLDVEASSTIVGNSTIDVTGNVTITNGGKIAGNIQSEIGGDMTIASGGVVTGYGKGHAASTGPGAGGDAGGSNRAGGGAGYGGRGGEGFINNPGGPPYGSIVEPSDLGSGGGSNSSGAEGGAGGGALRLIIGGTLHIDGALKAGGAPGGAGSADTAGGGGSGGSIYITVGMVAGSGTIAANGGNGGQGSPTISGGGGGGGRIAIYYDDLEDPNNLPFTVSASGGTGYRSGSPGSIYYYPPLPEPEPFFGFSWMSGFSDDPVNTATGNFTHEETDLTIHTRGSIPPKFSRFYNSKDTRGGPLGPGWSHSYYIVLDDDAADNQASVRWGDGQTDYWVVDGNGGYRPSMPNNYDELTHDPNVGTWTVTRKNLDVYQFTSEGRLVSITDKNGNTATLTYNDGSHPDFVTDVTDPAGRTLTLAYSGSGLLESVTDFADPPRTVQFNYTNGRLTQVTDLLDNPITYGYDGNGYLATITDQRGVTTVTNTYDGDGRVTEQRDGRDNVTTFLYDTLEERQTTLRRTVTVDGDVRTLDTIHTHETLFKLLISIDDPLGQALSYGYDQQRNRNAITDRNGYVKHFDYDDHGNVVETREANDPNDPHDGGVTVLEYEDPNFPDLPTRKTDALGYMTEWTYDDRGNVETETRWLDSAQTESVTKSWTYNAFGQKLAETDERGNVHEWVYDADGLLVEEIDWDYADPNSPVEVNHTWYGYDELWRQVWVTDGRGTGPEDPAYTTYSTYDDADRLTQLTGPPVGDPSHSITQVYGYDAIGNRTHVTDGNGNTSVSLYDNNSNLYRVEEPLDGNPQGRVTQHEYDELNRRVSTTDANIHVTTFTYDDADRLVLKEDAESNQWSYTYDPHGNVLTETDPSGVTLTYEYDALHRRTLVRDELNNEQVTEYDKLGRATRQIDAEDNETTFDYDGLGRLTCVVDAENGWTEYRYDAAGNLIEIEDARDEIVSVRHYDALNRLIYAEDGNGNFYEYGYDAVSNQTWVKDAKLAETFLTYDAESRLVQVDYPDATQVTYAYDDNGNRTVMTDPTGSSGFTYDELNRLRSSTDSFGQAVTYSYDPVGNRVGVTYPDTKQVLYGYDGANRLETITDWDSRVTTFTYDGLRIETVTYPNGVVETRDYDDAGRLSSMVTEDSASMPLLSLAWVRDGVGNPTSVTETGTLQPTLEQLAVEYEYDADNRLTDSSQGTYQHDANGNLTARTVDGVTTTFTYDAEDRLTSQTTGGSLVEHVYDGDGDRIARVDNGSEMRFVLDQGRSMSHVLCETDPNGVIIGYYVQGPQLVARISADGAPRYYHTNDIGSVVALTDESEQITDRYGYTPFGLLRSQEGATPNPFTYVGGLGVMADADGLYFMRARFYDPDTGRFLGKDPIEGALTDPTGLHRYVYGMNNPLVMTDASGEFPSWLKDVTDFVGAGLAAVSGDVPGVLKYPAKKLLEVGRIAAQHEGLKTAARVAGGLSAAWIAWDLGQSGAAIVEGAYHGWNSRYDGIDKIGATEGGYAYGVMVGGLERRVANWVMTGSSRSPGRWRDASGGLVGLYGRATGRESAIAHRSDRSYSYDGPTSWAIEHERRLHPPGTAHLNVPYNPSTDPYWYYNWTKSPY